MSTSSLVVPPIDAKAITLGAEFSLLSEQALAKASSITTVDDAESQELATQAASTIQGLLARLEKDRNAVKAPVLALGRQIDAIAKQGAAPLQAERDRLKEALRVHYLAEQEKARKAAEVQRRFAEARQKRLDEEARLAADAAQQAATQEEAEQATAKVEEITAKAEEAAQKVETIIPAAPAKAEKMTVRKVWRHEVKDLNALYAARPGLCRVEPNTNAINAEIRAGMRECPGLLIWEDVDVTARS